MIEQLTSANEGPEVHLVVTAREPLGLFTASWQECLREPQAMRNVLCHCNH